MTGRRVFAGAAVILLIGASGCAREPERQWYKIGKPYTTAEFKRDVAECTKGGKLDVDCMRTRGWVDVSPDRPEPTEPPKTPGRGY